ncbi:MAG: rhodanese-like domain-containing protein [Desulfonatronovibrio sp.]
MNRIIIVGQGYQVGKCVKLASRIQPKADIVWISDHDYPKYPRGILQLLVKSGTCPDQWSKLRAKIKVNFEAYQKSTGNLPVNVKKIDLESKEKEVSFLTTVGTMSYSFDKAIVFCPEQIKYPEYFQGNEHVWPESKAVEYLIENWNDFENPVVVGNNTGLVQVLARCSKKFTWVRDANLFSDQIQYFLDENFNRNGIIPVVADSLSQWKAALERNNINSENSQVFLCGNKENNLSRLAGYGLETKDLFKEGPLSVLDESVAVLDPIWTEVDLSMSDPEKELTDTLSMVEAFLGEKQYVDPERKRFFWNMGELSAASLGLNLTQARAQNFDADIALLHGHQSFSQNQEYALSMVIDKPTRKILGLEAVGPDADKFLNMGLSFMVQETACEDILDMALLWNEFEANPLMRCARILKSKSLPGILSITPEELKESADNGAEFFLLDVRSTQEFAAGRIPGASSIPLNELGKRIMEIPRFTPLVIYSECSTRAYEASRLLKKKGARQLYVLDGGYGLYNLQKDTCEVSPEVPSGGHGSCCL